jgi:hypothetical protein
MRYFTNSELACFKRCRRRWYLAYYRRLRLKARSLTGAAPIGTRVHQALEPWYQPEGVERVDPRTALETVLNSDKVLLIESWPGEPEALDAQLKQFDKEADLCRAMIEGYVQWLEETGADSDFEVIASESAVEYQIAPDVSLAGRLDTRVRRIHDGALLFIDHKTTDSIQTLARQLPRSEQVMLYEILQRANHPTERNAGALYNVLRKVKRTGTAKPPFYERIPVMFNDHQLESAWYRVLGTIRDIQQVEDALSTNPPRPQHYVYPTPTRDCDWECEFAPVCTMFDDGSRVEDMLQSLYEAGDPLRRYPELREQADS